MNPAIREICAKLRFDATETAMFSRELEHVQKTQYEVLYPELRGRYLVPMGDDQAPETAETGKYEMWDAFGMARVISHWAQDLPRVGVSAKEFFYAFKTLGESYGYTYHEAKVSAATGKGLPQLKARAAREIMERTIDEIIFKGMQEFGTFGLVNNPNVPIVSLPTGTWSSATAQQILDDLNYLAQIVFTQSKGTMIADTLVVDSTTWTYLQRTIGADFSTTIMRAFLANNPYIRNVEQSFKFDTAGADGGPRIMVYKRDQRVFDLQIPLDYAELPPEVRGLAITIACYSRVGGVVCRYPLGAAYCDNAG